NWTTTDKRYVSVFSTRKWAARGRWLRHARWGPAPLRPCRIVPRSKSRLFGHDAIANEVPQGDEELARQCDDHLLARATSLLGARFKPLGQGTLPLKVEEAPGELDHPFPHSIVAGSGKSLLAAFLPALVGRAREASVAPQRAGRASCATRSPWCRFQ